jgi:hypothetical protein
LLEESLQFRVQCAPPASTARETIPDLLALFDQAAGAGEVLNVHDFKATNSSPRTPNKVHYLKLNLTMVSWSSRRITSRGGVRSWSGLRSAPPRRLEDTMTAAQKIIRAKVGLLELAKQLGNVSQACKMLGYADM